MQEIIQILLSKIPDPKYQAAYAAHMEALVKILELAPKPGIPELDAMFAHDDQAMRAALMRHVAGEQVAGDSESKTSDAPDEGWRAEGLPSVGETVEIEIANGEILSGTVNRLAPGSHFGLDLLLAGVRSMPAGRRGLDPDPGDVWWTGSKADSDLERRIRWRIIPNPESKTQDEGWQTEGLPAIGDMVEVEVETGELLRGEVDAIDEGSDWLDLRLYGSSAVPREYRLGAESWWTGAVSNPDNDNYDQDERRIRWRRIPN